MLLAHFGNHLFRPDTELLRFQHDRGAGCIVRTDEMHFIAAHSLVTNPDISLDVLEHVTEMDGSVGIRKCTGYQNFFRDLSHSKSLLSVVEIRGIDVNRKRRPA